MFKAIGAAKVGGLKTGINAIFGAKDGGIGVGKFSPKVLPSIKKAVLDKLKLLQQGKIKGIPTAVK